MSDGKTNTASGLNEVEREFLEYVSSLNGAGLKDLTDRYIRLRARLKFDTKKYRNFCMDSLDLHELFYGQDDEKNILEVYRRHEFMIAMRFISYSFSLDRLPKRRLSHSLKRLIGREVPPDRSKTQRESYADRARLLAGKLGSDPVVVDYGCGFAYQSLQIAELYPAARTVLVDVDTINLRFAEHRFKKRGYDAETLPVTEDNLYPALPRHNVCIATEVMEHVKSPLTVFENINRSLEVGGMLYGDFGDHHAETYHVSHNLKGLREAMGGDYELIARHTYKRVR